MRQDFKYLNLLILPPLSLRTAILLQPCSDHEHVSVFTYVFEQIIGKMLYKCSWLLLLPVNLPV